MEEDTKVDSRTETTGLATETISKAGHHMAVNLSEAIKVMVLKVTKTKVVTDRAIKVRESTDIDQPFT